MRRHKLLHRAMLFHGRGALSHLTIPSVGMGMIGIERIASSPCEESLGEKRHERKVYAQIIKKQSERF